MSNTPMVIYIARTDTVGGRESGIARSSDGVLDIRFSAPGSTGIGTNPEQLLAAGWSASLASAIALVALKRKVALPAEVSIRAEVDLTFEPDGYTLTARLYVSLPGIERSVGQNLTNDARQICPFSKAFSLRLDVTLDLA
ncbi:Ohr family peroxiredoxin [Bosea sp. PAMC 26642]|uniref:Ohr family peroxiredoxin n=1 Tax=Bosea sp. (strain PAMC 26642) TaxID=1792307 RepID=UPI0009E6C156|nr:Ohr family peroxiredoxin [Bosea sp. PAMC 26642]